MARGLISLLESDHDRIRSLKDEIKSALDRPGESDLVFDRLEKLRAILTAHGRGEELALYSLFKDAGSPRLEKLRRLSRNGIEEHALLEQFVKELLLFRRADDEWRARFAVAASLLEHHLYEEESAFFPQVRSLLGEAQMASLADVYLKKRDQVFSTFERSRFVGLPGPLSM